MSAESEYTTNLNSPDSSEEGVFKVVIADQSRDAHDEARDMADVRLDQELNEGGRLRKFVSGIWKGNIAKDYYRQRYVNEAITTIQDSNDVLIGEAASGRTRALEATIERFSSDYDEIIHTEAGERREMRGDQDQLAQGVKHLIREFAEGTLNAATLQEERTRLLNEYRKEHGEDAIGQGVVTVDNLLSIAQSVAGVVEHGESLASALERVQVITGEVRNGARTEARYTAVDRVVDKLAKNKVGSLVTPGVLATGVAAAAAVARAGSHSVVGAATKTLLPGAAAGLWAGLRENRRVKDERSQHAREMATGGAFNQGDKRREEMDTTRYESIPAADLVAELQRTANAEVFKDDGHEAVEAALDALAAVQARIQLSDSKRIDLISYSSKADVGEERMMLDLARREARLSVEAEFNETIPGALGADASLRVKQLIQQRTDLFVETLLEGEGGLSDKDKAFTKLKNRRVASAVAIGAATGVIGGLIVQEAVAGVDSTRFGLIDAIRGEPAVPYGADGEVHQTILEGFIRGDETTIHTGASETYDAYSTTPNGSIEVSSDHALITNEDGTMDLRAANGTVTVEGLAVDANGTFDQASLDKLDAAGMVIEDRSFDESITTTTSETVSASEYLQNHSAETTVVKRDLWYGNDTPGVADHNELRLYRGGSAEAPGIIEGGYQYSVAGMETSGSWQGGEQVDWNQAAESNSLFVAVSGTYDTQNAPLMIPVNPDGTINISADSPAGKFFANENGTVDFKGAYMEVVQSNGVDEEGVVHIRPLATLVGSADVTEVTDTFTTVTAEHHAEYVITSNGYETAQDNFAEMAPITPIASRRSLESLVKARAEGSRLETPARSRYYNAEASPVEQERIKQEVSPRLRQNPDAELNPAEELSWYREETRRRHGDQYVQELESFIDNDPVLSNISNNTESIVTIPVAAPYEADNIYGTLSLYAQQDQEGMDKSVILLNLNWLDTAKADPEKAAAIERTLSEIERARRDFPQLALTVMQREYNDEQVRSTGGVIGYVAEDLVNTTLLAAHRKIASGAMDSAHDMLMVRGDADVKGLSRRQLANFHRAVAQKRSLDVVKGVTRFGVEDQGRFPGYGIISNFMSSFQVLSAHENRVHTGGANFGVRVSTLAAIGGLGDMMSPDENGVLTKQTGAGTDDVAIGRRVAAARNVEAQISYGSSGADGYGSVRSVKGAKRIQLVTGAAIDTSGDRLLAAYLDGENPHFVWNPEKANGFAAGPGGYRSRDADASTVERARSDDFSDDQVYAAIERALSYELRGSSESSGRKALAVLFGSVPGGYTLSDPWTPEAEFKLTAAGREFIKNRVERENNGRFGSYGARKMRQLYGVVRPGAKRRPASTTPPLVSRLT